MRGGSATGKRVATRAARTGRPSRQRAGEVEERILDAAGKIFLARGFEGASIDQIAEVARAGKPTIYARFAGKEALFTAVVARKLRERASSWSLAAGGATLEERLVNVATAMLGNALVPEWVGLIRSAIAEARRFPDLATGVGRMARERGTEAVAHLMGELARADELRGLPAFAADRLPVTARHFIELTLLPMLMRALFGEELAALRAEIGTHVPRAVAFFLAACRASERD
jgi:AcrR family transcriptional regulator